VTYFAEADAQFLFENSFSPEDHARLPYYSALEYRLAASPAACQILIDVRPTQRNPMLVFAILQWHALNGVSPLSELYQSFPQWEPTQWADAVVQVLEERPSLIAQETHRSTQTNEINRTAALCALLGSLRIRGVSDIHLIDVGSSMGFNLYPDFAEVVTEGPPSHPGQLETEVTSRHPVSFAPPTIHRRIGIDMNPLDPSNEEDVKWIAACLWPEQSARLARFQHYIEQVVTWPTAEIHHGDANELIEDIVRELGPGPVPVIFHSWVLAYLSQQDQQRWRSTMDRLVANGAIWISFESPFATSGLSLPHAEEPEGALGSVQMVVAMPHEAPEHWGWSHPHARWIHLSA